MAMTSTAIPDSPKSRLAAALLCLLFGLFGAHRFYVGKHGTALLMLFTLGGLGIWSTVDLIFIVIGAFRDGEGGLLRNWGETHGQIPVGSTQSRSERADQMRRRMEGIETQLTELQSTVIDLAEKFDRRLR